jgi:hypothetical protein
MTPTTTAKLRTTPMMPVRGLFFSCRAAVAAPDALDEAGIAGEVELITSGRAILNTH